MTHISRKTFLAATCAAVFSFGSAAYAAKDMNELPDNASVTINGTVSAQQDSDTYVIQDQAGQNITVNVPEGTDVTITKGDGITVTGVVDKSSETTIINATSVSAAATAGEAVTNTAGKAAAAVSNAAEKATDSVGDMADSIVSSFNDSVKENMEDTEGTEEAQATDIKNLPDEGLVQLTGTVKKVDGKTDFTLADATGEIEIDIAKETFVEAITEGARVSVIGYVDKGLLFGTDIDAVKVSIVDGADAKAGITTHMDTDQE